MHTAQSFRSTLRSMLKRRCFWKLPCLYCKIRNVLSVVLSFQTVFWTDLPTLLRSRIVSKFLEKCRSNLLLFCGYAQRSLAEMCFARGLFVSTYPSYLSANINHIDGRHRLGKKTTDVTANTLVFLFYSSFSWPAASYSTASPYVATVPQRFCAAHRYEW